METRPHANLSVSAALLAIALSSPAQPVFTAQPADQTANQGFSATFATAATTTAPPLNYQWFFASNAISSAITSLLTINKAQPADVGQYFVVVTDSIRSVISRVATLTVVPPVALDPKLSANVPLGDAPSVLPANRRAQTEPHIARSYADPNLLVAAFMEGTGSGAALSCGYSVSTNGGLTWSRGLLPKLTKINGGEFRIGGDVTATIDLHGHLFVSSLVGNGDKPVIAGEQMVLSKSLDSGAMFSPPAAILRAAASSDGPNKSWLAINTFARTATANRIAAVFAWMGRNNQTYLTYSDDGGVTWSSPKPVGSRNATGAQQFFLPDGSLMFLYWHFLGAYYDNNSSQIELVVSPDGGGTFGPTNVVQVMSGIWFDDRIAETGAQFPSACTDRQAGVIYLTYQAWNGAATSRVRRILFTKSIDKGQTWSAPVPVSDTPAGKSVFNPVIAASPDGQHVTVAFYDKRHPTTNSFDNFVDYYLAESFDGGDTWQPNIRLTEFSSDLRNAPFTYKRSLGEYQGIAPALNFDTPGVAVWIDTRRGNADPYAVRITRTKGTTFEAWRKLRFSTNDLADLAVSGENADPDGDGIPNLAEYGFGLKPNHADAGPLTVSRTMGTGEIVISFEKLAVLADVFSQWTTSVDLVQWQDAPATATVTPSSDPTRQRVTFTFPMNAQAKFFRLAWLRE